MISHHEDVLVLQTLPDHFTLCQSVGNGVLGVERGSGDETRRVLVNRQDARVLQAGLGGCVGRVRVHDNLIN